MKKRYEKPVAYFEDMSFDSAIADTCSWFYVSSCQTDLQGTGVTTCLEFGPSEKRKYFTEAECDKYYECYHVSAATFNLAYLSK